MTDSSPIHLNRQQALILRWLRNAGPFGVLGSVLARECCNRFGGRICELRKMGFAIEKKRISRNEFRYYLRHEPYHHEIDMSVPEKPTPYVTPAVTGAQGRLFE